jgi:hypothetical protein
VTVTFTMTLRRNRVGADYFGPSNQVGGLDRLED